MSHSAAYSISKIVEIVGGNLCGNSFGDNDIRFLLCDSRKLLSPQKTLFFALRTDKNDGHRYIADLLKKGVRSFVVEGADDDWVKCFPGAAFIIHPSPLMALQELAAYHRSRFSISMLAITGSNGKTVVKEWLHQLLFQQKSIVKSPKSFNSQIGVPLSVWLIDEQHELGVFEAGVSLPGEMKNLEQILKPEIGIFTNIGPAHDEGFESRQQKIREKLKLFTSCNTLIYCKDHTIVHEEILSWAKQHQNVSLFTWGSDKNSDIQVISCEKTTSGTLICVKYQNLSMMLSIPFFDDASIENAMHCLAFMKQAGYADGLIVNKMAELQPVAMRLEMKEGINDSTIINDSYNSDLHSLTIALDFLISQTRYEKRSLILSDILQSGEPAWELYAKVAELIRAKKLHRFIGIGHDINSQSALFSQNAKFYPDTESFLANFDFSSLRRETILVKGARPFGFERIINQLQQKDHQTILEINLDALVHNLNVFRALVSPGVRSMCMVKAFSYGSGTVEIARMLEFHQVDYLAVAYADEGKALRQGGVSTSVVVMNPEIRTFETLFKYKLEPEIYGLPVLKKLILAVNEYSGADNINDFPVHIKIDTGMHRLGFLPGETDALLDLLKGNQRLRVASVFSHFAASEDHLHDDFSRKQISVFADVCAKIEQALGYSFLRHIANSAAISRFPEAHFDMVRPGIGLYGVSGDPNVQTLLKHVSLFKTIVSQVKSIRKGETVGYGRNAKADNDMIIAILPVGYADGLNRRLGNGKGHLLIKSKLVPIVGNISMDMCAIDVTGLSVQEGDEVMIFGSELPVQKVAEFLDTIPYEVLTSVSQRVKRIYYQE